MCISDRKEGWLYTGDMGYMRAGLHYVLGRFKSLRIGSDGEKYSPEGIEEALVEHSSCIDQLILYNNQSPYTTALLVPNKERLRKHLAHQNLDLTSDQGREEAIRIIPVSYTHLDDYLGNLERGRPEEHVEGVVLLPRL